MFPSPFKCKVICTGGFPRYNSQPTTGKSSNIHQGRDFVPVNENKEVNWYLYSPVNGKIVKKRSWKVDYWGDYGNYVVIQQENKGYWIVMAHLLEPVKLSVGATVKAGDLVGIAGSTGNSSGRHLHIEVWDRCGVDWPNGWWDNSRYRVDPITLIDFNSVATTYTNVGTDQQTYPDFSKTLFVVK